MTNHKLLPCPFCGVQPLIRLKEQTPSNTKTRVIVECSNGIDCPVWPITNPAQNADEAARRWNTRHQAKSPTTRAGLTPTVH